MPWLETAMMPCTVSVPLSVSRAPVPLTSNNEETCTDAAERLLPAINAPEPVNVPATLNWPSRATEPVTVRLAALPSPTTIVVGTTTPNEGAGLLSVTSSPIPGATEAGIPPTCHWVGSAQAPLLPFQL